MTDDRKGFNTQSNSTVQQARPKSPLSSSIHGSFNYLCSIITMWESRGFPLSYPPKNLGHQFMIHLPLHHLWIQIYIYIYILKWLDLSVRKIHIPFLFPQIPVLGFLGGTMICLCLMWWWTWWFVTPWFLGLQS